MSGPIPGGGDRPLLCLLGPTATGKTALAVELVARLPLEIVSVDSVMVYRGMDIGTAKPPPELRAVAPHHLVDILDPAESYSAARFVADAERVMAGIRRRGRIPLLVGGTFLYFRALCEGLGPLPAADPRLRARLAAELRQLGTAALHARLRRLDPAAAERIHPNDPQRIQRALEVCELTGRPMTEQWRPPARRPRRCLRIALVPSDRQRLDRCIEARLDAMLAAGLVAEVEALFRRPDLGPELPSMRAVGYRQVWQYLAGDCERTALKPRILAATRQYAKRQLTWLKKESIDFRFDPESPDLLDSIQAVIMRDLLAVEG